jgi:drug/metabolite transporter (DMT)-like permease
MNRTRMLLLLMLIYAAASLTHFIHNGLYIHAYPNLPHWVTPFSVYLSWCVIAVIGALGFWLYRRASRSAGLLIIGLYALLGFGGLDHYAIAPVSAHTLAMNASIIVELSTAFVLLCFVVLLILHDERAELV